jgi:SAM-dependent methyltransferase
MGDMTSAAFTYTGTELDALSAAKNYYSMLVGRFAPHVGERVVEVGAGVGTFGEYVLSATRLRELLLIEPADNNFPVLAQRFADDSRVRAVHGYLEDLAAAASADTIVAVNVLEHVPDDAKFLDDAWRILEADGKLLLFVPALPFLFGTLDEAFEHHRRYTRMVLASRLVTAGFEILDLRYVNLPGVLSWFIAGRVLRKRTITLRDARLYDRWITPTTSWIERRWSPPLGQSLFAVARKNSHANQ